MKQQQGAALVIVMALLSGALMLGMSGMQSALIDERLAGNYRATVQAKMNSDSMMSEFRNIMSQELLEEIYNGSYTKDDFLEYLNEVSEFEDIDKLVDFYIEDDNGDEKVIITMKDQGTNNNADRETIATYRRGGDGEGSGGDSNDNDDGSGAVRESLKAIMTCYGTTLLGGAGTVLDSFDSTDGPYRENGTNIERGKLVSLDPESEMILQMGKEARAKVDVFSAGNIEIRNTMPVDGSLYSLGDVSFVRGGSNALITKDVYAEGKVRFDIGARVDGDIESNVEIRVNGNWGEVTAFQLDGVQRAGTSYAIGGNATAPVIYTEISNRIEGAQNGRDPKFEFREILKNVLGEGINVIDDEAGCPDYGVQDIYNNFSFSSNLENASLLSWNGLASVEELGSSENIDGFTVYHVNQLDIAGNGVMITEPTVIVADSNVNITLWGESAIHLADGASLQIITKGKVDLKGSNLLGLDGFSPIVENDGIRRSAYSIVSLYDRDDVGISSTADGDMYLELIAPFANVEISGSSRLLGRVYANRMDVSGGGSVHYDRAYDELSYVDSETETETETEGDGDWQLVGWQ